MREGSIPWDQLVFGNPYWNTPQAIDEIVVYCDLIAHIDCRIASPDIRHENEKATMRDVQLMLMAYALEIAIKSLWAMDNPDKRMCRTHALPDLYKGLQTDTTAAIQELGLTEDRLNSFPCPFVTNRFSMEYQEQEKYLKEKVIVHASFLKQLGELVRETLNKRREALGGDWITFE